MSPLFYIFTGALLLVVLIRAVFLALYVVQCRRAGVDWRTLLLSRPMMMGAGVQQQQLHEGWRAPSEESAYHGWAPPADLTRT